jgi:hypothetical protein
MMNDDAPAAAREQPIFARRSLSIYPSICTAACVCLHHTEPSVLNVRVHAAAPDRHTLSQPIDFYANANEWKTNQPDSVVGAGKTLINLVGKCNALMWVRESAAGRGRLPRM